MASDPQELASPLDLPRRWIQAWNWFWFHPADPTPLGFIRLCCGLMVLYIHLAYTYDLQTFFGANAWLGQRTMQEFLHDSPTLKPPSGWDTPQVPPAATAEEEDYIRAYHEKWGVDPRLILEKGHVYLWSIWFHVTDPTQMELVHGCILVAMFCFMIGFCTRITSVLTWFGMMSCIQRAQTSLFGMDTMLTIAVTYLMIGPSGAALSVDRLLARYWATRQALRSHRPIPEFLPPQPSVSANVALRMMQVHVCIVYLVSGTSKLMGASWWTGYAVWETMANWEFSPMRLQVYMAWLRLLSRHRWLWELVTTGGTYATLAFEISFAFLIWSRRMRGAMIIGSVLLHLGIALCMGLVGFSAMMLILVSSFLSAKAIRTVFWQLGRGPVGLQLAQLEG